MGLEADDAQAVMGSRHARFLGALPSLRTAVVGALLWACVMAASVATSLLVHGWQTPAQIIDVAILYAVGAAIAFPLAYALSGLITSGRHLEARLAAALLCFTAVTIGTTAFVYALDYRTYYAAWHAEALSIRWFFEFAFTVLGALVQFVVSGVRLYFPIGFVGLLAVSCWFARHAR